MPWSQANPPSVAKNWTPSEKKRCVKAANAALRDGKSERDAIFACISAAGKGKKESSMGSKENSAQQKRSQRYRIEIREDGNVTKPPEFSSFSDSEFGDPVNYFYPVASDAEATSAKSLFADDGDKYKEDYSRVQVRARLNRLARKYGVEPILSQTQELDSSFMVGEIQLADSDDEEGDSGLVRIPAARTATFQHPWWGEIYLDSDLFESFIDNWKTDVVGHRLAIDESHMPEKGALAWFKNVTIEPDDEGKPGLVIYAEKTKKGDGLGDVFKYASIEYREHYVDRETGVDYGPTLMGAAATNRPFVNRQGAMTTLNMPMEDIPEEDRSVNVVFLTQERQEVDAVNIEVEDAVGTGEFMSDGTEVVSLDDIQDPGEEVQTETVPAPAEEPVNPEVEVVTMSESIVDNAADTAQVGTITLNESEIQALIAQNRELKEKVKSVRISEVLDKAMGRGVPPVVLDVGKQVLMALEPDAKPTIQLAAEPGESAKSLNLFDAVAALMDSVPGRGGEFTLTNVGEKPAEKPRSGNPYVDEVQLTAEEAEEEARKRREALGINTINQSNAEL